MDEKVLDAAQELYEVLRGAIKSGWDNEEEKRYKASRRKLLEGIGREALPPIVQNARTLDEAVDSVRDTNRTAPSGVLLINIRVAFDAFFARLESAVRSVPQPLPPGPPLIVDSKAPRRDPSCPRIFISHRSDDVQLAQALVDLLVFSMRLEPEVVRCTSVPGHDLRGGERTDDRLRQEIADAEIFLALVTPASLRSHFVLFELGARWGIEPRSSDGPLRFIPLIGRGLDAGKLPRPLADFNCLDLREEGDVAHLLAEISSSLSVPLTSEAARTRHVRRVTAKASDVPDPSQFSQHEQRILRALFSENEGRFLTWYRQDADYGRALASLTARELIRESDGKFVLRSKGRAAAAAYLATLLEEA